MGYQDGVLSGDEQVVLRLHPHWIRLVGPAAAFAGILGMTLFAVLAVPAGWFQHVAQWFLIALAAAGLYAAGVRPWLRWITTIYMVTTERILIRTGIFSRSGRDIPLQRVTDVSFQHSFRERLLGSGTLTIVYAGEHGRVALANMPQVEQVYGTLYRLAEEQRARRWGFPGEGAPGYDYSRE